MSEGAELTVRPSVSPADAREIGSPAQAEASVVAGLRR